MGLWWSQMFHMVLLSHRSLRRFHFLFHAGRLVLFSFQSTDSIPSSPLNKNKPLHRDFCSTDVPFSYVIPFCPFFLISFSLLILSISFCFRIIYNWLVKHFSDDYSKIHAKQYWHMNCISTCQLSVFFSFKLWFSLILGMTSGLLLTIFWVWCLLCQETLGPI